MESLENRRLLAVVAFDESLSGDVDSQSAFLLDMAGTNTWQGTLETAAPDLSDAFQVDLAPAVHVTDVRVSYLDVDPGTDPDSDVEVTGTGNGSFNQLFSAANSDGSLISVGGFDVAPYENASGANETFSTILFEGTDVVPAGDWQIEIDTAIGPMITTAAAASADENQTFAVDVDAVDDLDSEGSGLTYSISGGDDETAFTIDASSGVVQFMSAPDFEMPTDMGMNNVYEVEVTVTDSDGFDDSRLFQITVNDVNEPPVAEAGGPYMIDAGLVLNVDASGTTDPDAGDTLTYDWDLDDDGNIDFSTNNPIDTIPWLTVIDHISVGSHQIRLTVTDSGGEMSTDTADLDISDLFIYPADSNPVDEYTLVVDGADLEVVDTNNPGTLLSRVPIADILNIAVIGNSNSEVLTVDVGGGAITAPISFDGNLPVPPPGYDPLPAITDPFPSGDTVALVDSGVLGDSILTVTHTFQDESTGSIGIDFDSFPDLTIQYTGLEPIIDNLDAMDRVFTFTGGAETINLSDDGTPGDDVNRIDSDLGELVVFTNPTTSVTVNAGSGADTVNLPDYDSSNLALVVNLNGGADNDTFNLGNATNGLGDIQAIVNVRGDDHLALPENMGSVTAKGVPVLLALPSGDEVNIADAASAAGETYSLSHDDAAVPDPLSTLAATTHPAGTITFATVETVTLDLGDGDDNVTVAGTDASQTLTINAADGNDTVEILDTGDMSLVTVNTGEGEDGVTVTATGDGSILDLNTGNDNDTVFVTATGSTSGLNIDTGLVDGGVVSVAPFGDLVTIVDTGDDSVSSIATGDGSDVVNVRGTGDGSSMDIFTGDDLDTVNISSDADGMISADRAIMRGNPSGSLDGIGGEICVFGGDPGPIDPGVVDPIDASVTAKGVTVDLSYERGDELNVSDESDIDDNVYTLTYDAGLDETELTRDANTVSITYQDIETANIETGTGADEFTIDGTDDRVVTMLVTGDGDDTIDVSDTGEDSILTIETGDGEDEVSIALTGDGSLVALSTGNDNDTVFVTATGSASGLDIDTGLVESGSVSSAPFGDLVTIVDTGADSVTAVATGDGTDVVNVRGTGDSSFMDLFTGDDADTVNISSNANGMISADRAIMSGDPSGTLDGIGGEICVFGGDPGFETPGVTDPIEASVIAKTLTVELSYEQGDELNVSDEGDSDDNVYNLDYDGVLDNTEFTRTANAILITYEGIETANFESGTGDDQFTIEDTDDEVVTTVDTGDGDDRDLGDPTLPGVTITTTGDRSILIVSTGAGADVASVATTGEDSVTRIDTGSENDDVTVTTTGEGSGLEVLTGAGDDLVNVTDTGLASALNIQLGEDDDIANVLATGGEDAAMVRSATEIAGDEGTDTINLSSDADGDRADPDGDLDGNLDGFLGDICVFGGDNPASVIDTSVTARQTIGIPAEVTLQVENGDVLNLSDEGNGVARTYTLDDTTLTRTDIPVSIEYETIETLNVETGSDVDTVAISDTADATLLNLDTFDGADVVTVSNTGDGSITNITTGLLDDTVSISSVGDAAGLSIDTTGAVALDDTDTINLLTDTDPPALPLASSTSVIALVTGLGVDTFNVDEVFLNTVVDASGGEDNDVFNLTAAGADAAGYLEQINDPAGGSDADAATRQLFLDGGSNDATSTSVIQGVTDAAGSPVEGPSVSTEIGDRVNVDASSAVNPLDLRYVITGSARGVLATTTPGTPRSESGNEVFETLDIESVDITSGTADDLLTISSEIPIDVNGTNQLLDFDGGVGEDKLEFVGSEGADLISVGVDATPNDRPFEITAVELLRIDGNGGDDQISAQTPTLATLNGGLGNDNIFGGFVSDFLTGGPGVDNLYGGAGDDLLVTDQDFGSNETFITEPEVLNGGSEVTEDICIQLGDDEIIDCERVGDGGGRKDVLTWLRAVFTAPVIDLGGGDNDQAIEDALEAFEPVADNPIALLSVTEPSQISYAVSAQNNNAVIHPRVIVQQPRLQLGDVNRDGLVSVRDALMVINHVGRQLSGSSESSLLAEADLTMDVNGNGTIEPHDALLIINQIARNQAAAEGEEIGSSSLNAGWAPAVDTVFGELADDSDEDELFVEGSLF